MQKLGLALLSFLILTTPASGRWKPEYAELPQSVQDWYKHATVMPQAQKRFEAEGHSFVGCCEKGDRVLTKFKVSATGKQGEDEWYYLTVTGIWKKIPDDIIHWGERAPDGEAVLFVYYNEELCFYPPESGN